jgi:hypothetical protein
MKTKVKDGYWLTPDDDLILVKDGRMFEYNMAYNDWVVSDIAWDKTDLEKASLQKLFPPPKAGSVMMQE